MGGVLALEEEKLKRAIGRFSLKTAGASEAVPDGRGTRVT
jgi:hypothetical protein